MPQKHPIAPGRLVLPLRNRDIRFSMDVFCWNICSSTLPLRSSTFFLVLLSSLFYFWLALDIPRRRMRNTP
ncbi:hypothetical protein BDV32DRAFT_88210 [Aspergillus pseudonomiae]|nr:hypothetical protein BDV32DRAFT_88210 [Aspergillus pseudonomiae]